MGGVYNTVNASLYHHAGNNPIKYTDPLKIEPYKIVIKAYRIHQMKLKIGWKITDGVQENKMFTVNCNGELKSIGESGMKNKMCIAFGAVFLINIILACFLYKYNASDLGLKDTIILLIGSYIFYWLLHLYILFLKTTNQFMNYAFLCVIGAIAGSVALCVFILNLKNDPILFFPIKYVVSMLATFFNWIIAERKS